MNVESIKLNKSEAATVLGLTTRRISQLVADGVLTLNGGKLGLVDCVQAYIAFCKGKLFDDVSMESEKKKLKAEAELKTAKAKVASIQAAELEGRVHRSEDVEAMMVDFALVVRSGLLSLPSRLAVDVSGVSTAEASDIIKREVFSLLSELSEYEYDPAKYRARVRERMKLEAEETTET